MESPVREVSTFEIRGNFFVIQYKEFIMDSNHYTNFSNSINKDLKGTKTEKNLQDAYCGESKARNNYTFFAQQARKEGYEQIARIFEETANNEREHGKIWFKILNGGSVPSTLENLETAASNEDYEWEEMYAGYAKIAKEEGFEEISRLFETIRNIEKMHMTRYKKLIEDMTNDLVFKKPERVTWECGNCGFTLDSTEAPEACPFCKHPKAYFFEKCFNY